ncbi:late competence development ComFB family protein [Natranaerobius thermophilus]|uniref:Late competence development protein ComFB n=1 Tax=Natranaerobius thermophilus (strain ATCC BAA-1301 / DSM 18059 / JW/NM-WN-LF) TaxID=457570 RepID=B2A554_NATTJ|nr:late competence development ComFB family protein [Natranaerobius thermophilus]ACB85296.1 conserved hypothetical protein [Natranaerobius thermophilus JW/NM-WN-LF]
MSDLKLQNYMEKVVEKKLEEILTDRKEVCDCQQCKLDIMALALNDLPPRYVVTEKGEVFSKIDSLFVQFSTDVTTAIIKAIDQVKTQPRH